MRIFGVLTLACLLLVGWVAWRLLASSAGYPHAATAAAPPLSQESPAPAPARAHSSPADVSKTPQTQPLPFLDETAPTQSVVPPRTHQNPLAGAAASTPTAAEPATTTAVRWADEARQQRIAAEWNRVLATLDEQPDHPAALRRAIELSGQMQRWAEMVDWQRRLLAVEPENNALRFDYAAACLRIGLHSAASGALEELVARQPDNLRAWHNLAVALREQRRLNEALAAATRLLELTPGNVEALAVRAELLLDLGDPAGASRDLGAALHLAPSDIGLRLNRALALRQLGEPDESLAELERVLEGQPRNLLALNRLAAWTWERIARRPTPAGADAARVAELCRRSLAIDANQPEVRTLLEQVTALRHP